MKGRCENALQRINLQELHLNEINNFNEGLYVRRVGECPVPIFITKEVNRQEKGMIVERPRQCTIVLGTDCTPRYFSQSLSSLHRL